MIISRTSLLFLVSIIFSSIGLFPFFSHAQTGAGITLIPATIEERADPGSTLSPTLKITNESAEDKEYYLYKKNIKGVEAGGVPIFAEEGAEKTSYELSEWVSFASDRVFVKAGESVEIPLLIVVPAEASPGSHFGGVFVSVEPPKLREVGAGVGYEVASIISIRISGDVVDTARIRSFSTDKLLYGSKDVHFTAKIENQGNILIRPRGPMTITGMFGNESVTMTVNDSLAGVFPGTARDIEFDWNSEGLGFGKYTGELALVYDGEDGNKTIDAVVVFWVFPIKVMLGVLAGFITIIGLGYFLTRYYINQAIMRASGGRRITSGRRRRQVGVSRFVFVFISVLAVLVVSLIILLIFIA